MASKYYNLEKVKPSGLELKERLVGIQRVTKVTKGGRTFSFSAIMVVGNEDGVVGHGMGKAQEVVSAITKGTEDAKKNLYRIPVVNATIPHEQNGKIWWFSYLYATCISWYRSYRRWCDACSN